MISVGPLCPSDPQVICIQGLIKHLHVISLSIIISSKNWTFFLKKEPTLGKGKWWTWAKECMRLVLSDFGADHWWITITSCSCPSIFFFFFFDLFLLNFSFDFYDFCWIYLCKLNFLRGISRCAPCFSVISSWAQLFSTVSPFFYSEHTFFFF